MDNLNDIKDLLSFHYFAKKEISPTGIHIKDTKIIEKTDLIVNIDDINCRYYIRDLYDFFDSVNIHISIIHNDGFTFVFKDNSKLNIITDKKYKRRNDCELMAFKYAFKYLNKKIIKKEIDIK